MSLMVKGSAVAALVHGICGYGIHLGRPARAGDGCLAGVIVLAELQQVVASEVVALECPVQLLLGGLRHGGHDHGVVQGVPCELEILLGAHATNLLVFQVPPVHASQALTTAQGVSFNH